jgi:hypothetical protein
MIFEIMMFQVLLKTNRFHKTNIIDSELIEIKLSLK